MKKILIFGSLPPPIGGVRVFVKYLVDFFRNEGHSVDIFPSDFSIKKYDVSYINYSSPIKRFIAAFISLVFCKRSNLILHSSEFKIFNPFNFFSVLFCNGVITTSEDLSFRISSIFGKGRVLLESGLLYKEFLNAFTESIEQKKSTDKTVKKVLFYQNNNEIINGRSIYGSELMLSALCFLENNIKVVWVDLSGEVKDEVSDNDAVIRYSSKPLGMVELYQDIDLLVRPTAFDGTAFMLVEALAHGVPVLCSDVVKRPTGSITFSLENEDGKSFAKLISDVLNSTYQKTGNSSNSICGFINFSFGEKV